MYSKKEKVYKTFFIFRVYFTRTKRNPCRAIAQHKCPTAMSGVGLNFVESYASRFDEIIATLDLTTSEARL
jgi:hypothetical protein